MNEKCGNCGSPNLKQIPAGVSKRTGKPYQAFASCQDCKTIQNYTPKPSNTPPSIVPPPPSKVEGLLEDIRDILMEIRDSKNNLDPDKIDFN